MDGREVKQRAQSAQEMTEEINRATDVSAGVGMAAGVGTFAGAERVAGIERATDAERTAGAEQRRELGAERARGIGSLAVGQVLTYNPEAAENERVREMAEVDNGYARNEIAPNLSSVGMESSVEVAERLAEDQGNLQAELSPEMSFDAKIQNKNQEEIGEVMAVEVGNIARKKSFSPSELVDLRNEGTARILESFTNPRKLGDRN